MTDDEDLSDIAGALNDQYTREILAAASQGTVSANELDDRLDADLSTIYRRLERLENLGFVSSRIELSNDGRHYRRYRAHLRRVTVDLVDGKFAVQIVHESTDPADCLADFFEELR